MWHEAVSLAPPPFWHYTSNVLRSQINFCLSCEDNDWSPCLRHVHFDLAAVNSSYTDKLKKEADSSTSHATHTTCCCCNKLFQCKDKILSIGYDALLYCSRESLSSQHQLFAKAPYGVVPHCVNSLPARTDCEGLCFLTHSEWGLKLEVTLTGVSSYSFTSFRWRTEHVISN